MALISVSNNALSNITALPASIPTGDLTLIKSITASASASIEFINGTNGVVLDGTYSSYIFSFSDIHPATDNVSFQFQGSTNSGVSYGVTFTTTKFSTYHDEANTATGLDYQTGSDHAQTTSYQHLIGNVGNGADESCSGVFQIFNPSSTTYVKHFISNFNGYYAGDYTFNEYVAGYFNTTSAINAIDFQFASGNINDGTIKLYGVK